MHGGGVGRVTAVRRALLRKPVLVAVEGDLLGDGALGRLPVARRHLVRQHLLLERRALALSQRVAHLQEMSSY